MAQRYERELVIEQRDPNELLAHPQNYRAHPAEQIEEIAKSLRALGQYRNVVIRPDGTILAGHGVVEAARKVGMATVAVHIFEGTAEQEHLLMVADNELSRKAVDDEHALHGLLKQLQQEWGDLGGTGWDDDEHEQRLAELAAEDFEGGLAQEDPGAGEVPEEPQTRLGDVWLCGEHRVVCGDSTTVEALDAAVNGGVVAMVFADPPYGISVVGNSGNIGGDTDNAKAGNYAPVVGDDEPFDPRWILAAFPDTCVLLWGANYYHHTLPEGGRWIVWDKNRPEGTTFSDCELAWVSEKGVAIKKYKCTWDGFHREGESGARVHPTQKPVLLCANVIKDFARDSGAVADPFLGSGTTLIAAEQLGRIAYGIELEPRYVDVAVRRWAQATGQVPTLEADGTEFEV